jgi:hypothetical protein
MRNHLKIMTLVICFAAATGSHGAFAEAYYLQPVYELPESKSVVKAVGAPFIPSDAKNEVEACNQLVYMVGTRDKRKIRATVCSKLGTSTGEKCRTQTYNSAMISGGSIAKIPTGATKPVVISQLNSLNNPGTTPDRECDIKLSWNPANTLNREIAYEDNWVTTGGALAHVRAGTKNPLFNQSGSSSRNNQ